MKYLNILALVLVLVGGLNWGLVGAFQFNLVDTLFGEGSVFSSLIYILVGVSALYGAVAVLPKEIKE